MDDTTFKEGLALAKELRESRPSDNRKLLLGLVETRLNDNAPGGSNRLKLIESLPEASAASTANVMGYWLRDVSDDLTNRVRSFLGVDIHEPANPLAIVATAPVQRRAGSAMSRRPVPQFAAIQANNASNPAPARIGGPSPVAIDPSPVVGGGGPPAAPPAVPKPDKPIGMTKSDHEVRVPWLPTETGDPPAFTTMRSDELERTLRTLYGVANDFGAVVTGDGGVFSPADAADRRYVCVFIDGTYDMPSRLVSAAAQISAVARPRPCTVVVFVYDGTDRQVLAQGTAPFYTAVASGKVCGLVEFPPGTRPDPEVVWGGFCSDPVAMAQAFKLADRKTPGGFRGPFPLSQILRDPIMFCQEYCAAHL